MTDVPSPGKCLQQETHEADKEERHAPVRAKQDHPISVETKTIPPSNFSGNTFSVFLAYIF